MDLFLSEQFLAAAFADVDHLGIRRDQAQNFTADQRIVKHRVGSRQQSHGLHGEKFRIPWPSADQIHLSHYAPPRPARGRRISRTKRSNIGRLAKRCSRSFLAFALPVPARSLSRAAPSQPSQSSYSWPNCFSNCKRRRCASAGLLPLVEIAICRSPRCTTAP